MHDVYRSVKDRRKRFYYNASSQFYVLLTVHPCMILKIKSTWCAIFLSMFISFLYMFRATVCQSSGEITVHMVLVILYGQLSGMQGVNPAYQEVIHTELQIPSVP
jgi:hypothetical protein